MTAINSIVLRDRLHVFSDGAHYDRHGVIKAITSKISQIPSYPGIVAVRGATYSAPLLAHDFGLHAPNFDRLLEEVETLFPFLMEKYADQFGGNTSGQLFLGGWSETRRKMELYFLSNDDLHLSSVEGEDTEGAFRPDVGELQNLATGNILPGLMEGDVERGFDPYPAPDQVEANIEYIARTILELQRQRKHGAIEDSEAEHIVGGFVQLTTVSRDGISTRILHRWPDTIGETIRPAPVDWAQWRAAHVTAKVATLVPDGLSRLQRERMEKKARKGTLRIAQ